jgi:zinc protease
VQNQIQAIATELATHKQQQSEIDRIIQPKLEQTRRNYVTNVGYWMELLADAQDGGGGLEYIRSEFKDYQGMTPDDVLTAAKKWFKPETAWRLKVVPKT